MPVFEVEVTVTKSVTETVVVQADDESAARVLAQEDAYNWDMDMTDTTVESIREVSTDEAIEFVQAGSVVTA